MRDTHHRIDQQIQRNSDAYVQAGFLLLNVHVRPVKTALQGFVVVIIVRITKTIGPLLIAVTTALLPTDCAAEREPPLFVLQGQEVAVSYDPATTIVSADTAPIEHLNLGDALSFTAASPTGGVGTVSRLRRPSLAAASAIAMEESEISSICDQIRAYNPGSQLRCEPNYVIKGDASPNDPHYGSQWGMQKINAPKAAEGVSRSGGIIVAIIDTGIDYNHPDLAQNIEVNLREVPNNKIDDDLNGYVDDYYGYDFINFDPNPMDDHFHGTHCAGIVGAVTNNKLGVVGVAGDVRLLAVKALASSGVGTVASVASAINYAVVRGAKVINLSLGTDAYSQILEDAVINAQQHGAVVVVSAGNDRRDIDITPKYPASSAATNVLTVASSGRRDLLSSFSNWGGSTVEVAAPGEEILSTFVRSRYAFASGTSMAAPHVSGIVALILAANPTLLQTEVIDLVKSTVDPVTSMTGQVLSGGRANAYLAVSKARESYTPPAATPPPEPTPPTLTPGISLPPTAPSKTNTITINQIKLPSRIAMLGVVTDSKQGRVSDLEATLVCGKNKLATTRTNSQGGYRFFMKYPSVPVLCWVQDDTGTRSRKLRLR